MKQDGINWDALVSLRIQRPAHPEIKSAGDHNDNHDEQRLKNNRLEFLTNGLQRPSLIESIEASQEYGQSVHQHKNSYKIRSKFPRPNHRASAAAWRGFILLSLEARIVARDVLAYLQHRPHLQST
jgi:hypothetical protein